MIDEFASSRQQFVAICEPLQLEDYNLQAAEFVSPPKWHLAHTSWFYETFILKPFKAGYEAFNPAFQVLFNSYYNGIGEQYPRPQRGLLSRPSLDEVLAYRRYVDVEMTTLLQDTSHVNYFDILSRCELGIQHEKQHQELFFTDIKYSLSKNILFPAYSNHEENAANHRPTSLKWLEIDGGLVEIGKCVSDSTFGFDNESPRHKVFLAPFLISSRLVTNAEYQEFIDDGGYERPELWLADGWSTVKKEGWQAPLYWLEEDGQHMEYTLTGLHVRDADRPVCHVSAYEADAYANWKGARLVTESEWEVAANASVGFDSQSKAIALHPSVANTEALSQLYDACWQWTSSAYRPYPGFSACDGAIGEYNGKFMCNQWVLRGGSCVSPNKHLRASYRNFFYPADRWQFSGIRLAKSN